MNQPLNKISDQDLRQEYARRFCLKAGAEITDSVTAARHFLQELTRDPAREVFAVMYLNGSNYYITSEILFKGTLTSSPVFPREIIRQALAYNAAAVILAHNHPSGNPKPSRDDLAVTKKIQRACETVDIVVHDHLILAGKNYFSLKEQGLL